VRVQPRTTLCASVQLEAHARRPFVMGAVYVIKLPRKCTRMPSRTAVMRRLARRYPPQAAPVLALVHTHLPHIDHQQIAHFGRPARIVVLHGGGCAGADNSGPAVGDYGDTNETRNEHEGDIDSWLQGVVAATGTAMSKAIGAGASAAVAHGEAVAVAVAASISYAIRFGASHAAAAGASDDERWDFGETAESPAQLQLFVSNVSLRGVSVVGGVPFTAMNRWPWNLTEPPEFDAQLAFGVNVQGYALPAEHHLAHNFLQCIVEELQVVTPGGCGPIPIKEVCARRCCWCC
jgi:hypothetical protein